MESSFEEPRVLGRIEELEQIRSFLKQCIEARGGGALYVCGHPGTGKTEAVKQIIDGLKRSLASSHSEGGKTENSSASTNKKVKIDNFHVQCAWVSGNADSSAIFFSRLIASLGLSTTGKADVVLESAFTATRSSTLYAVVVDECDLLPQETLRRLFAWANASSSLCLIGIANVVNAGKLFQSLASQPTELPFAPYNEKQLEDIIKLKLGEVAIARFDPKALEMCSRKVAARTGDVRSCLSICERALSSAVSTEKKISLPDIVRAVNVQYPQSKVIYSLPAQCRYALVAISNAVNAATNGNNDVVELKAIQDCWSKLHEVWKIPTEGSLQEHLQQLCDCKAIAKEEPPKRGKIKNKPAMFRVLCSKQEILDGLLGMEDDTETQPRSQLQKSQEDTDLVNRRPIIMAFKGIKPARMIANMHQVSSV